MIKQLIPFRFLFIAIMLFFISGCYTQMGKVKKTSARDYELGRTPRASAKFLNKYRERIVFGTDMGRKRSMYQIHWRLFETADDYIPGRVGWRYYGLELPDETLKALYRDTAKSIFRI